MIRQTVKVAVLAAVAALGCAWPAPILGSHTIGCSVDGAALSYVLASCNARPYRVPSAIDRQNAVDGNGGECWVLFADGVRYICQ